MGNYYEGSLLLSLSKARTPEEIIKKYEDIEEDFATDRGFCVDISTKRISEVQEDDFYDEEEKEEYVNYLEQTKIIDIRFGVCTKHYIDKDVENVLLNCIKELKPYIATYEEFVEDSVVMGVYDSIEEARKEFSEEDYNLGFIGTVKDEDFTYRKDFYLDEEVLKKEKEARSPICGDCDLNKPNSLCNYYKHCLRAYTKGRENMFTDMGGMID